MCTLIPKSSKRDPLKRRQNVLRITGFERFSLQCVVHHHDHERLSFSLTQVLEDSS